nr:oxidoreductase [uncultured Brevundimonas sp.]
MRYRPFGAAGAAVSNLTFSIGTDTLSGGRDATLDLIYSALEAGINSYRLDAPDPVTAEVLGEALAHVERDLVCVSLNLGVGEGRDAPRDFSAEGMTEAIDQVLNFSGLGWIDVAVLQEPGEHELQQSSLNALKKLRASGRVKLLGVAGGGDVMDAYVSTGAFDVLMTPYDIHSNWKIRNRIRAARQQEMTVFVYDYFRDRRSGGRDDAKAAAPRRGFFGIGAPRVKPTADPYDFLYTTPRWTAEAISLTYALIDPSIASAIIRVRDKDRLKMLAETPERDLPPGLAAQIEMAGVRPNVA